MIKPQPPVKCNCAHPWIDSTWEFGQDYFNGDGETLKTGVQCPYGKPGDELWVRETFSAFANKPVGEPIRTCYAYKADDPYMDEKWKPSIHMPREASRIQLTVTDIRVERIQDIEPNDIIAEGIEPPKTCGMFAEDEFYELLTEKWISLWDSINADRGYSWESNPWVWIVEFKVKEITTALEQPEQASMFPPQPKSKIYDQ